VRAWLGVASLVAVGACHHGRWNGDKSATELRVGELTIAIPKGWRSMAELSDSGDVAKYVPRGGDLGMMPATDRDGVLTATILIGLRTDAPAWKTCDEAVQHARDGHSPPISQVHDGGSACTWHVAMARLDATVGIRKLGDRELDATCLIDAGHDPEGSAVCSDVLRALQIE
jgi:hypothetical protein